MKRLTDFLLIVLMVLVMALPVSANSPAPSYTCSFYFENLPEGTVYVDLLIPLSESDPMYTDLVRENLPNGMASDAPIVTYSQDGFRSYSLHYKGSGAAVKVDDGVVFFTHSDRSISELQREDVAGRGGIRLAMLASDGTILQVSGTHELKTKSTSMITSIVGTYRYDAEADRLITDKETNVIGVLFFVFISLVGMALTCVTEWFVAWPFGLDKRFSKLILLTNVISQTLMRIVDLLIRGFISFSYLYVVLALEILVYAGEFLFYRKKMTGISWKRCLLYTAAANTASLVLGLWMFKFVF